MSTKIEWTDKTWNPIVGCSKISPACDHCYAEKMAFRLSRNPKAPIEYRNVVTDAGTWNGKTALVESVLDRPRHWRMPYRVFVGSMTDLFHQATPFEWVDKVFHIMGRTPHITYQVLTKRPDRMREYMLRPGQPDRGRDGKPAGWWTHNGAWPNGYQGLNRNGEEPGVILSDGQWPLHNVWLGVTVENQEQVYKRIPILIDTPASVRFVSVEPMLGPVRLDNGLGLNGGPGDLDWVICGGETGPGARRMDPEWVGALWGQCEKASVPFFFKKWGSYYGICPGPELCRDFPAQNGGN